MTFFNPASLLAGADVAVKAPPASTNTAAFAIGSAMESIRNHLKKKKEVDDLTRDTEALASYMDNRSPDLAAMLRSKVSNYKPTAFTGYDAIDVKGEKDKLLQGVISLYGKELESDKLDASGNSIALQNNYGAKLRAAESQASNVNNNWNTWESNETRRETEYENNRHKLATEGKADGIRPFVRGTNPYTAQKTHTEDTYNRLLNANQNDIMGMSTPSKISRQGNSVMPSLPSSGIITPMTSSEKVADQERVIDTDYDLPTPEQLKGLPGDYGGFIDTNGPNTLMPQSPGYEAAVQSTETLPADPPRPAVDLPMPQLTSSEMSAALRGANDGEVGKVNFDPPRPAVDLPMPQLTSSEMSAALRGANEGEVGKEVTPEMPASAPLSSDPIERLNEVAKQNMAGNVKVITSSMDQLIGGIKREKGTYIDKATADQAITAGESAKEDILSLPDPGSKEWINNAKVIVSAYKASIATLQRNSASSEKKEQQVANQEQQQYYIKDSISKDPVTVYKRIQDGIPRFYILEGGKETEVTNRIGVDFLPLVPGVTPTKSAASGGKVRTLQDLLK